MTKDLLFAALRHEDVVLPPWVPFAGIHAGKLKGYTARQILTDGSILLESLLEVNKVYDPDGQPVMFDLQLEAEILGCQLVWVEDSLPSVATHPLETNPTVPSRLPEASDGRLPMVLDVMRRLKAKVGHKTALLGLVTGPFTLASHLRGTEIFMDMVDQPEYTDRVIAYATAVAKRMAELYINAGMDVIAYVDPVVSQISPRHFNRFLSQSFTSLFSLCKERGVFSSMFVCGDATKNIEVMCQTGPDSLCVDENINMAAVKQITDRYNITLGGNIPLTTRMLLGTQQDNMLYVVEEIEQLGAKNLIIAPGCDMPYDTPIENVIGVVQAVRDPIATHAILQNYHASEASVDVVMPDYAHLERPLVEVFTVDSATCAACGYMFETASRAHDELNHNFDLHEYKITQPENISRIKKLGLKNLPAIVINGDLKFSSIIPGLHQLVDEIEKAR